MGLTKREEVTIRQHVTNDLPFCIETVMIIKLLQEIDALRKELELTNNTNSHIMDPLRNTKK